MGDTFADRLTEAVERKGAPACVGIDPVWERLPAELTGGGGATSGDAAAGLNDAQAGAGGAERGAGGAEAGAGGGGAGSPCDPAERIGVIESFSRRIIELVEPFVAAVKINVAFFEVYHEAGLAAYRRVVAAAREAGLIVIGDVKRGDIGHTSQCYARAHLGEEATASTADAITVNPYFGIDGVEPFIQVARSTARGVFVLVRTSNPSSAQLQGCMLASGRSVAEEVADLVHTWSEVDTEASGCGFSCVGAVVAPTRDGMTGRLRVMMPRSIFLVPGFGAQGRTAEDVRMCFNRQGRGAIVTSSRGVIYAHARKPYVELPGATWETCVQRACRDFADRIRSILPE